MAGNIREMLNAVKSKQLIASFVMEARRHSKVKGKKGSGDSAKRSRFLSVVMPQLAGDPGKAMAEAIEAKDLQKFKDLWNKASNDIFNSLEKRFKGDKNE